MTTLERENIELRKNIAELEARLFSLEIFINSVFKLNENLKTPPTKERNETLAFERLGAKNKYGVNS